MGVQAKPRARVSCCQAGGSEEGGFHCQGSPGDISISTFSLFWSGVAAEFPVSLSHASGALVPLGLTSSGEGAFLVSQGCPEERAQPSLPAGSFSATRPAVLLTEKGPQGLAGGIWTARLDLGSVQRSPAV